MVSRCLCSAAAGVRATLTISVHQSSLVVVLTLVVLHTALTASISYHCDHLPAAAADRRPLTQQMFSLPASTSFSAVL